MIQFITNHYTNLLGFVFFVIGAFKLCSQYLFIKNAIRSVGRFKGWMQDSQYLWKPIVVFTTKEGREIEFISPIGSNPKPGWEMGRPVNVLYEPTKPEKAQVYTFLYFWLLPAGLFFLGLLFTLSSSSH